LLSNNKTQSEKKNKKKWVGCLIFMKKQLLKIK
jgi:hypothetical protein